MRPQPLPDLRFVVALALSAAVHLLLSMSSGTGSPGGRPYDGAAVAPSLTVRLVFEESAPLRPDETPVRADSMPIEPRVGRAARVEAPPVASPRAAAVSQGDGGIADSTYYPARQLDIYPTLATPLDRAQFEAAKSSDVKARVLLLVLIDAAGAVDDVSVAESGAPAELEELARRAFLAARFTPAQKNGRAVKSRVLIEVNYGEALAPVD